MADNVQPVSPVVDHKCSEVAIPDGPIRIEIKPAATHSVQAPPLSRFHVGNLALWVTCSAIDLGVLNRLIFQEVRLTGFFVLTLHSLVAGAVWMGTIVFISRLWREQSAGAGLGEWLIMAMGLRLCAELLIAGPIHTLIISPQVILTAVTACTLIFPTLSKRLPWNWKLFYYALTTAQIAPVLIVYSGLAAHFLQSSTRLQEPLALANCLIIGAMAVSELRGRNQRGWLHWWGLGISLLILGVIPIISSHI